MRRRQQPTGDFAVTGTGRGYAFSGELTFATASQALEATRGLFGNEQGMLSFDLAGISSSDSAGVALLIEWLRLAGRTGITLRYARLPENLEAMARVCGVAEILPTLPA